MKIARAVIENFKHIKRLELDFTDSLGRVRDVAVIIGPNASGKTTILDALAVSIGLSTELSYGRPGFTLSPRTIVTKGSLQTKVTCWVKFSPDEISATRELFRIAEETWEVPDVDEVELTWTYPDPNNRSIYGFTRYEPSRAWTLFKGRVKVARLLSTARVGWNWFERVGGIFTFDQQRAGMGRTIPREIWEIIQGQSVGGEAAGNERRTSDPKTILLALAVQSLLPPSSGLKQLDQFKLIQERYAQVCGPRRLVGAIRDDLGTPELLFNDGTYDYWYDGLSSGEQMLLLFLIRMVSENVHRSIVLVDEVELHQHPIWQRKLLYLLPKMGIGNQIIATTHSPYLRDVTPPEAVIELGEILEPAGAIAD